MPKIQFVSDLHGKAERFEKLFEVLKMSASDLFLIGGDILPSREPAGFLKNFFFPGLRELKNQWGEKYSSILVIPGNDDSAVFDKLFVEAECEGLLHFISMTKFRYKGITFIGYPFVPPTPFQLKDREKYDVSRFVDPGCLPPDVGRRTVVPDYDLEYSTIAKDLELFSMGEDMNKVIFLFHCPPYQTPLDRAALDGQMFDHVPLDVHIGSIAIRRFIEEKQPFMTLHGHVHESFRITGAWKTQICKTLCYSAASDKPWLCVVSIDTEFPEKSSRHELE